MLSSTNGDRIEHSFTSLAIFSGRNGKSQEMVVNLHEHSSGQAKRLLKCHLSTLYGIPCE